MRWLDGITDSMDMNVGKLQEMVREREAWHAAVHRVVNCQTRLGSWTTTMSSLAKCLFRSSAHCLIAYFVFPILSYMKRFYILEINPLSVISFAIIFSHSEGCLLILLIVSFAVQKLSSLIRFHLFNFISIIVVQFSSVPQSCLTICNPVNHSMPGLPVYHQLPESTQTHVHWVSDAIQPSHPLSSPSPPALNLSQHQGLFKWVSPLHQVAKVLEFQLHHQSLQWTPRADLL